MDKDQELEALVQRMLDAGESEDNIALVVRNWDAVNAAPQEPAAPEAPAAPAAPMARASTTPNAGSDAEPLIPPGLPTAIGAPLMATNVVRTLGEKGARNIAKSKNLLRLVGGTAGATIGGTAGSMVGSPFGGATLGAYGGGKLAKKAQPYITKAATAVADALSTSMPRGPKGQFLKIPAGRNIVNAIAHKAPYIGAALTAYDILSMIADPNSMPALKTRLNQMASLDPSSVLGGAPQPAPSSKPEDTDALMAELMQRVRPTASH